MLILLAMPVIVAVAAMHRYLQFMRRRTCSRVVSVRQRPRSAWPLRSWHSRPSC